MSPILGSFLGGGLELIGIFAKMPISEPRAVTHAITAAHIT